VYPKGFDSIFNARSCETLQQYKARTMDCGTKDSCDVTLTSYAAPGRVNVRENQETRSKTKISKMMTDIVRSKLCPFFYLFVQFVLLLETQGTASSGLV
jgi:hypothetical protein